MSKHILIPVDESDRAFDALTFAFEGFDDARFTALHVIDPADFYAATGIEGGAMTNYDQLRETHENRAQKLLEEVQDVAAEHDVELETETVMGGVSKAILRYAEDEENAVDQIVIGSHGRTGASRILLGSVAEKVARRSPVPVTIVR